jgi:hypothetical protein
VTFKGSTHRPLLILKIRYLPALEWNIVSFQQRNLKRETNDTTPSCLKFSGDAVCGIRKQIQENTKTIGILIPEIGLGKSKRLEMYLV